MSIAGILSSSLFSTAGSQQVQTSLQKMKSAFGRLGQDLKSGNASGAQSDFVSLQQSLTAQSATSSGTAPAGSSAFSQQVTQLGQDLKSGNLAGAQTDYASIQQSLAHSHLSHQHHQLSDQPLSNASSSPSQLSQLLSDLGTALQSNQLTGAQQAYSSLQQSLAGNAVSGPPAADTASFAIDA